MRIGDILYFSTKYKFTELEWDDKDNLLEAFQDRVRGFYIEPIEELNKKCKAFAAGVLCVVTIDFLARIETSPDGVQKRFEYWVGNNIKEFYTPNLDIPLQEFANRFYKEFRNGLVHEGRIKKAGQFSYNYDALVEFSEVNGPEPIMIINPKCLQEAISKSFEKYIDKVQKEESIFQAFKCALMRDFQLEVEYARR
jgi:hypothetical protein